MRKGKLSNIDKKRILLKRKIRLTYVNHLFFLMEMKLRVYVGVAFLGFLSLDFPFMHNDNVSFSENMVSLVQDDEKSNDYLFLSGPQKIENFHFEEENFSFSYHLTRSELSEMNSNSNNLVVNGRERMIASSNDFESLEEDYMDEVETVSLEEMISEELEVVPEEALLLEKAKQEYPEDMELFMQRHMFTDEELLENLSNSILTTDFTNCQTSFDKICAIIRQSNLEKKKVIQENLKLTDEEYAIVEAIVLAEARRYGANINNYEDAYIDAYAVANNIDNRASRSIKWINEFGNNVYSQVIAQNQYATFSDGSIDQFLNTDIEDLPGHQAFIDYFYTREPMHEYLKFLSHDSDHPASAVQFAEDGNWYYSSIKPDDYYSEDNVENVMETEPVKVLEKSFNE